MFIIPQTYDLYLFLEEFRKDVVTSFWRNFLHFRYAELNINPFPSPFTNDPK